MMMTAIATCSDDQLLKKEKEKKKDSVPRIFSPAALRTAQVAVMVVVVALILSVDKENFVLTGQQQ